VIATPAKAEHLNDFLATFAFQAKSENPDFSGFSANRGEQFFKSTHSADWSCSSCHTENPVHTGKHIVTQKPIEPLAPSANAERFTNPAKVEKWFKRNCKDVVGRECTTQEKGDVLSFLQTVGG
jgi:hypothetical protein